MKSANNHQLAMPCRTHISPNTDSEQEMGQTGKGLFEVVRKKFKSQHNQMILLLQYCKLIIEESESTEKWMSHLRVKASECEYKKWDR